MPRPRQPDSDRSYHLYRYLLCCLAAERRPDGSINNQKTAQRVGGNDDLRRTILKAVVNDEDIWHNAIVPGSKNVSVTTGWLVEMLGALRESLAADYEKHEEPYSRVLTTEDILIALYQLIELTPEERKLLGLPVGDRITLLKKTLLSLQTKSGTENYEAIFKAYKEAVGLEFSSADAAISSLDEVNDLIEASVRSALGYLPNRSSRSRYNGQSEVPGNEDTIDELSRKAQREVRHLLVRSGNTQSFLADSAAEHPYICRYLQPAFVKKLAQTVVNNERLTAQLPVYLKAITIENCGPLPFSDTSLVGTQRFGSAYPPLLNEELQALDGHLERPLIDGIPRPSDYELASQGATKITLGFYIKVPTDYESETPAVFEMLSSGVDGRRQSYRRVDFAYSNTGIGGTLSHIIKIINTTLLADIPCLDSFFPIAHDITSTQTTIRDNVPSPIWAHSLVTLCRNQSVGKALWAFQKDKDVPRYEEFAFGDPIGQGDFCGFDFLIAQAQSAVQARLQAIRNAGVNPETYVKQLCEKVELQTALKEAWGRLKDYPFSSMAMIGSIHKAILKVAFKQKNLGEEDADIYFDALLSITEALLDEGAYKAAYKNIKRLGLLEKYAQNSLSPQGSANIDGDRCEVFSSTMVVRYLICKATYYYLYDLKERDPGYCHEFPMGINRQWLVEEAWKTLGLAQRHVNARLKKYIVIGEVSQGTFSPHYKLLARIYMLRARLLTFFPRLVPEDQSVLQTENFSGKQRTVASVHWGKLYLLEKARLYIAAEGNSEMYAYYAALQSCYYLTAAYDSPKSLVLNPDKGDRNRRELTRDNALTWAKRLRDHALLAYAETGRQCYNAIKEKSGLPNETDEYGRYSIKKLPAIFEDRGLEGAPLSEDNRFLTIDISLLAVKNEDLPKLTSTHPDKSIYLFGTNACHLFFARGLYLLCSDTTEEFERNEPEGPIQWGHKLAIARRLLDMAWAIAEDGCSLEKNKGDEQKRITRSFQGNDSETQYTSREIESVRDLYPRRVSEIADIGKIFSAACMVLQMYILEERDRAPIDHNIANLFAMFHGEYRLKENKLLKALISRQERYNGHLEGFFENARDVLERYQPKGEHPCTAAEMETCRNELMSSLFSALLR